MNNNFLKYLLLIFLSIAFIFGSVFVVQQGQKVLLLRLGKVVKVVDPGLHFKLISIDYPVYVDTRLQTLDVPSSRVLTEDQKAVDVDYYVKWKIIDPEIFYKTTSGDNAVANNILLRKINDLLRACFGDKPLVEVISDARDDTVNIITSKSAASVLDIGVEIVDVRIRRIDYPSEVTQSVYMRMQTQREQVAKMYRANGMMKSVEIQSDADKQANIIIADAKYEADKIRADGDAKAAEIANEAYKSNVDFYQFWRMIKAYEMAFKQKSLWIIDPKKNIFDFKAES